MNRWSILALIVVALVCLFGTDRYCREWVADCYQLQFNPPKAEDLIEITCDEDVRKAIADDASTDVYVIYFYRDSQDAQRKMLSRLNGHFQGKVKFLCVDVAKHLPPEHAFRMDRGRQVPYVEINNLYRAPATGHIAGGSGGGIFECPIGYTDLRLLLDKELARPNGLSERASDGGRNVPGWDWDVGIRFPQNVLLQGVIEECHQFDTPKGSMRKIKLAGNSTEFIVDRHAAKELDLLEVGDVVRLIYILHGGPPPLAAHGVARMPSSD